MTVSRTTTGLLLLGCLAIGLRVAGVAALWRGQPEPWGYEHAQIAENLLAGRGFSVEFLGAFGPTSQQAPFYPLVLAAAYGCFGLGSAAAVLAVQLLQCLAGTALVLAVVWLGWSLAPERRSVGWIAGLLAAVFPTHLYMVTHLQVVTWAALGLTLLLAIVVSPRWRATWGGAILVGCTAGALLLVEPILVLALPICLAAFWSAEGEGTCLDRVPLLASEGVREFEIVGGDSSRRLNGDEEDRRLETPPTKDLWHLNSRTPSLKQAVAHGGEKCGLARAALFAAIPALIITPWTIRNLAVHGEFVFIKSTFGYALWQGNNPASWGTDKIPKPSAEQIRLQSDGTLADVNRALWEARRETLYIDDVVLRPADYREMARLGEPERSRLLGHRAWRFIRGQPVAYLRLCAQRLNYFLLFDQTNPKAANPLYRVTTLAWLALAIVGLFVSRRQWRRLWPTYAIFLAVTLFHAMVITSARFRIPLEPMTLVWAAWPLAMLVDRLRAPR